MRRLVLVAFVLMAAGNGALQAGPSVSAETTLERICTLIADHAERSELPAAFLARLIWTESRFDANAVSPVGAEGIAQFMPATAEMRGLADSFDIEQAIPASAAYLDELRRRFGNLGLAAAAYNSGESRLARWLAAGGFLPLETENYVRDIMGEPVANFAERGHDGVVHPLEEGVPFAEACERLPLTHAATVPMARVHPKPWGVQVAGNFRRAAATRQYERLRERFPALLAEHEPVVGLVRSPLGRRGIHAVRIGADDRAEAEDICHRLRQAGGACLVLRNR